LAYQLAEYLQKSGSKMTDETFLPTLIMYIDDPNLARLPITVDYNKENEKMNKNLNRYHDEYNQEYLLWRNKSVSAIRHVRYERMDEHVPTAFGYLWQQQRYEVSPTDGTGTIDVPRPWGPYYLGVYDLANIVGSGALFIRKVSMDVDPNMIHLLPVHHRNEIPYIQWPNHVTVSPKPDWDAWIREVMESNDEDDETLQDNVSPPKAPSDNDSEL
jgi:hypothetical protein